MGQSVKLKDLRSDLWNPSKKLGMVTHTYNSLKD